MRKNEKPRSPGAFSVDAAVAGLQARGAELVGEVERFEVGEAGYRLCYVRGPEGIIVELAEQIG